MNIKDELLCLADEKYGDFISSLNPTVNRENIIGVRVPMLRKFASEVVKCGEDKNFLDTLPHKYFDENLLHSIILSKEKNFDNAVKRIDEFLPYIDNWAVCDTLSPKVFKKTPDELLINIKKWVKSDKPYTVRFGVSCLMSYFLDDEFKEEYLQIPAEIKSEEYYVNMMIAWYYATALAKQWDMTIPYIEQNKLSRFVNNKTIRKAIESYRITKEQKEYLRKFIKK